MESISFLNDLNEAQRAAVVSVDGPHLVIAGAGSGKTRVLTYRLAFILSQGLAYPQELLALTFTNKAAREMKERIYHLVGAEAKSIVMGTFHSIFSRILRVEAEKIGYTKSYTIYDADDAQKLVRNIIKEKKLDDKVYKPKVIYHAISMAKNKMVSPQEYADFAADDFNQKAAMIYRIYEQRIFKANAMDFDDLLLKPILLFQSHPDVLYKYQHRFKYLLVDEYQDTNHAQYTLTKMLAAAHHNICVVGDDAQSIYAFRGANIQNILNLQKDYPDLKIMKLEQNYRSTQNIVNAANSIIARNKDQIEKRVFTQNEEGDLIRVIEATSEQDEAKRVSSMIREQKQLNSFFHKDFAILYRTNAQSRAMEDELRRVGIPYRVFGGLSFYQRKEIKDVVAYLKLAVNPQDEQALRRIINYPTRGIGKTSFDRIVVYANDHGLTLWETLTRIHETGLNSRITNKVKDFVLMIQNFGVTSQANDAFHAANYIAKQSGILTELHSNHEIEGLGRWENVQELLNSAQAFVDDPDTENASLEAFLADISLFTDQDSKEEITDYVTLMTIHSAKGLEFKSVFLVGMEENLFPSSMSMESRADLEEERRLFYVAVTRAEKSLAFTYAKSRYRFGNLQFNEPSRFLDEVDADFLVKPTQSARRAVIRPMSSPKNRLAGTEATRSSGEFKPRKGPVLDPNFKADDPKDIVADIRVLHQKFGKGRVLKVEGNGAGKKATVLFEKKGQRVLLLKYAKLQIIS
ncbi:MAG: UvrD-helicase domain-containing protein [Bacteroidota bacterium]